MQKKTKARNAKIEAQQNGRKAGSGPGFPSLTSITALTAGLPPLDDNDSGRSLSDLHADRESYPQQTPPPDSSHVYIPPIVINPNAADDNCGDANKLADGTADGTAHTNTPFILETIFPEVVHEIASKKKESEYQPERHVQTMLEIEIDPKTIPKNIQMKKNFFGNARGSTFRAGVVRRPWLHHTLPAGEQNKKPSSNLKLQVPLKVDTIDEILHCARSFHSWNPYSFGLSWDSGVPRGIMTAARAYQVLHAEENGKEDCFQQFLKNPTKKTHPSDTLPDTLSDTPSHARRNQAPALFLEDARHISATSHSPRPSSTHVRPSKHAFDPRKSHYPAKSTKTQHFSERDDEMSPKRLAVSLVSLARSPKSHLGTRTTPLIALLSHSSPFPHSFLFDFVL
ncbi:hypothetical protein HYPSUDRAFT_209818 [Hypholoma sublateritium FD-334 SS-4]|uniref:Uncharacterized protein n=1 Tax=Hypholoma sublateritium (strain FD-334 SS-4) TaxID=945553 RepID=A0A0D2KFA4_HYPSF|nr:hypothetical protein HYPSUDRAFT_209818 [Hypholoma sublateritium FD-334 SS-4]